MIPDEAFGAALEVFRAKEDETYLEAMRAALEAAAPYIMGQAWDEGHEDGFWHLVSFKEGKARNPYRAAGAGE